MAKLKVTDEELESEAKARGYTITRETAVVTKTFRVELTVMEAFDRAAKRTKTKMVDAVTQAFRDWTKKNG